MKISGNMTGMRDLERRLQALSKQEATKAGQSAIRSGAVVVQKAIRARAPVSEIAEGAPQNRKTKGGQTRVTKHKKIINHVKVKKTKNVSTTKVQTTVYVDAPQAIWEEFGSVHNAANPFMLPAAEDAQQEMMDKVGKQLSKILTKKGA